MVLMGCVPPWVHGTQRRCKMTRMPCLNPRNHHETNASQTLIFWVAFPVQSSGALWRKHDGIWLRMNEDLRKEHTELPDVFPSFFLSFFRACRLIAHYGDECLKKWKWPRHTGHYPGRASYLCESHGPQSGLHYPLTVLITSHHTVMPVTCWAGNHPMALSPGEARVQLFSEHRETYHPNAVSPVNKPNPGDR